MSEIYKKLQGIQKDLKVKKKQYNEYGGFYYRSLEDILEALKPLLQNNELILKFEDQLIECGDRFYIRSTAIISDGEDSLSAHAYAREQETKKGMDASQITGATTSYARKFATNALFAIDDTTDADAQNNENEGQPKYVNEEHAKEMKQIIEDKQVDFEKFLKYMGAESVEQIPFNKKEKAFEVLKKAKGSK